MGRIAILFCWVAFLGLVVADDYFGGPYNTNTPNITCTAPFQPVGDRCLLVDNQIRGTWDEVREFCNEQGGDLVNMHDANALYDIAVFLKEKSITKQSFWIGAYDLLSEGHWVWSWNNTAVKMSTPLWGVSNGTQEPNGGTLENCAMLNHEYYYYVFDEDCKVADHSAICFPTDKTSIRDEDNVESDEEIISSEACPSPFTLIGGSCLLVDGLQGNGWYNQKRICENLGGYMAQIEDANVFGELYHYLDDNGVDIDLWIGGSDAKKEGTWVWLDGTAVPMTTPFWGESTPGTQEPAGGQHENCLCLSESDFFFFHDEDCNSDKGFICQYDI